ncbi:unnamed protein product [Phyllotreta striolata]|uniref:Uncharacterized protein n=1 Tax=Phyllotreta striolata TaxID=444603 RepID=A0A9N9XMZ7_PHYSR|nr:unnamed protein product [Phyllotreta striolata]
MRIDKFTTMNKYIRVLRNINYANRTIRARFDRNYSKKIGSNGDNPYKHVKHKHPLEDACNLVWKDPSFELLTTNEFPLFLRGDIGLAWYDTQTTAKTPHELILEQIDQSSTSDRGDITVKVQKCPTLLRDAVKHLFPYRPLDDTSELSVVTVSLRPNAIVGGAGSKKNGELEVEKLAQTFLITARKICDKLRLAGYWADFINPFSGRPYFSPSFHSSSPAELYSSHEKFRCLGFEIEEIDKCKVISNEDQDYSSSTSSSSSKRFVGSLFTSAACNKRNLNTVFN